MLPEEWSSEPWERPCNRMTCMQYKTISTVACIIGIPRYVKKYTMLVIRQTNEIDLWLPNNMPATVVDSVGDEPHEP